MKQVIHTENAPRAIGSYSQAICAQGMLYISGQIALSPGAQEIADLSAVPIETQVEQVFDNLSAICQAAGGGLDQIVKLTVYLIDLQHMRYVNEVIASRFSEPYPARVGLGVAALPKGSLVEIDAIMTTIAQQ